MDFLKKAVSRLTRVTLACSQAEDDDEEDVTGTMNCLTINPDEKEGETKRRDRGIR